MRLSELYAKYNDLILLHGMGPMGAIDNIDRPLIDRMKYIVSAKISTYLMPIKRSFEPFLNVGVTIKEADIIAISKQDAGYNETTFPVKQMVKDHIKKVANEIYSGNFSKNCELYINNASIHSLYYIKNPEAFGYYPEHVFEVQKNFYPNLNVYEIDHTNGSISLVSFESSKVKQIKKILNRDDLF